MILAALLAEKSNIFFCFEKAQIIQAKIEEEKNQEEIMAVGRLSDISSTALLAG